MGKRADARRKRKAARQAARQAAKLSRIDRRQMGRSARQGSRSGAKSDLAAAGIDPNAWVGDVARGATSMLGMGLSAAATLKGGGTKEGGEEKTGLGWSDLQGPLENYSGGGIQQVLMDVIEGQTEDDEIIEGVPNWVVYAAGALGVGMLLKKAL